MPANTPLLFNFICQSPDGYAWFDPKDKLIFANDTFLALFADPPEKGADMSFEALVKWCFENKRGINIETDDIEDWLSYVMGLRRSKQFRLFETDTRDGRWFLFSEQIDQHNFLMVQAKEITEQKQLENQLREAQEELRHLALTDSLTQIANRRCFVDSVEMEMARCEREHFAAAMLAIDIDHFKQVNDTYGHLIGDEALKHVSQIIKNQLRDYDIIGRLGGEEFGVFISNTDREDALALAERIRTAVATQPLKLNDLTVSLTVSIGLTESQQRSCCFANIYHEADVSLYQAKHNGRNQTQVYRPAFG